jgi:predicted Zn-dependent peptidase
MPAVSPSDADYVKFVVMDSLLGGSFGSRITANIRENKGYTYSPYSSLWNRFKTATGMKRLSYDRFYGRIAQEILFEIDRLRKEPPTEAELQASKNYLVGIYVLQNSTRRGRD